MTFRKFLTTLGFWLLIYALGQYVFFQEEHRYLNTRGVFLDDEYNGLFFSTLIYAKNPQYTKAYLLAFQVGGLLLLPTMLLFAKDMGSMVRKADYAGNVIRKQEMDQALARFETLKNKTRWRIVCPNRNTLWVGIDLLSGEHVYLEDEAIFKGTLIVGSPGTGKTATLFKVLAKQLVADPIGKTSSVLFTLKDRDTAEFQEYFKRLNHPTFYWTQANIVELLKTPDGALEQGLVQAILTDAAIGAGLAGTGDPFWITNGITQISEFLRRARMETGYATLGDAFMAFHANLEMRKKKGEKVTTEMGVLETLRAGFAPFADPISNVSLTYSPAIDGGLHFGPLMVKGPGTIYRLAEQVEELSFGYGLSLLPADLYELSPGVRTALNWSMLLEGKSLILPPPGAGSRAELLALLIIKGSLINWIKSDIGSEYGKLLQRDPLDRFRIVLLEDECQNFQVLKTDVKALQEFREAGFVVIRATPLLSGLMKGRQQADNNTYISSHNNIMAFGVTGPERQRVLELIPKVDVTSIRRSYSRQEVGQVSSQGLQVNDLRAGVTEAMDRRTEPFISPELYGLIPKGCFIFSTQGSKPRLVFCPFHDRTTFSWRKSKGGN